MARYALQLRSILLLLVALLVVLSLPAVPLAATPLRSALSDPASVESTLNTTLLQVEAGFASTCVINSSGQLYCWGSYSDLPGDLGSVSQVSVGSDHTCAVTSSGTLRCWGANDYGQTTVPSDLGSVSQISAGWDHTCAVTSGDTLRCWGDNYYGQGTVPSDLGSISQVSAGYNHTCAVTAAGALRCWGLNNYGQATVPGDLGSISQVSAGGLHTCAVTAAGALRCWGLNNFGEATVPGDLGSISQVSSGEWHTCAVTSGGTLRCWGWNNSGQTTVPGDLGSISQVSSGGLHSCVVTNVGTLRCWGANDSGQATVPGDLGSVSQVSVGGYHTCAVTAAGRLRCWGSNGDGEATVPSDLDSVGQVSAGSTHTCAVTAVGTLRCWGNNGFDQVTVPGDLGSISQVSSGWLHTCAVTSAGTVHCWGDNYYGQATVPSDLGSISQVSTGDNHTCAVTAAGTLRCWGANDSGQATVPSDLGSISQVSAGNNHTCAVTAAGTLRCWGANDSSQVTVPGDLGSISQVSAGGLHSCAITAAGTLRCWRANDSGQATVPSDLGSVSQVSAGGKHSCAMTAAGTPRCWGDNSAGQSTIPRDPLGLPVTPGVCARFVADLNYPDGTAVNAGASFTKRWQLRNCGDTPWSNGYQAVRTGGSYGPASFAVSAAAGATVEVAAPFTAPTAPGVHRATYRLQGPGGFFGDSFWVEVRVQAGSTYSISGNVRTSDGMGIPQVRITASNGANTATDANGHYQLDGLSNGTYQITASKSRYTFNGPVPITLSGQGATVNFRMTAVDSGLRPVPHGYNFSSQIQEEPGWGNYPESPANSDLIPMDVRRMFGDSAVCIWQNNTCAVREEARIWMRHVLIATNEGRCLGAAVTAQRFFNGDDRSSEFSNQAQNPHDLFLTNARRNIAYHHVQQFAPNAGDAINGQVGRNLSDTISLIRQGLAGEIAGIPVIVMYSVPGANGKQAGHAVTPYALYDQGEGRYTVQVYENAFPGQVGYQFNIDTRTNRWTYSLNPQVWNGNNTDLGAIPLDVFKGNDDTIEPCPWCSMNVRQVAYAGLGMLYLTDAQNRRTGMINGVEVQEIPDVQVFRTFAGPDTFAEPLYQLSPNGTYTFHINGSSLEAMETQPVQITQFSADRVARIDDITADHTTDDVIVISPDGTAITYQPNAPREVTFHLAATNQSVSYGITISGADVDGGQTIAITSQNGRVAFNQVQATGGVYDLHISRIGPDKTSEFLHRAIAIAAGDIQYLDYGAWNGGNTLTLLTDNAGDGSIDTTTLLLNQVNQIYLPLLRR